MKVEILEQNGHNFLWIDGDLWMWDVPSEITTQKRIAEQAYGRVLVVGYGLGIVHEFLQQNKNVTGYCTVEKHREVIKACRDKFGFILGDNYRICNFYEVPRCLHRKDPFRLNWDCIIGDICPEIQPMYLEQYKRFKQHAETMLKPDGKILAWGQDYFEWLISCEVNK